MTTFRIIFKYTLLYGDPYSPIGRPLLSYRATILKKILKKKLDIDPMGSSLYWVDIKIQLFRQYRQYYSLE